VGKAKLSRKGSHISPMSEEMKVIVSLSTSITKSRTSFETEIVALLLSVSL